MLAWVCAWGSGCAVEDYARHLNTAASGVGAPGLHDPTQKIRAEHYASWPKEIREAVDHRQLRRGMDKLQLQAAMHLTEGGIQKWEFKTSEGPAEKWMVYRTLNGWSSVRVTESLPIVLILINGVVVDMYR